MFATAVVTAVKSRRRSASGAKMRYAINDDSIEGWSAAS